MFCAKSAHFIAESFVRFVSFLLYCAKVLYRLFVPAVFRKKCAVRLPNRQRRQRIFNHRDGLPQHDLAVLGIHSHIQAQRTIHQPLRQRVLHLLADGTAQVTGTELAAAGLFHQRR